MLKINGVSKRINTHTYVHIYTYIYIYYLTVIYRTENIQLWDKSDLLFP